MAYQLIYSLAVLSFTLGGSPTGHFGTRQVMPQKRFEVILLPYHSVEQD